jgi:hypothetical protein
MRSKPTTRALAALLGAAAALLVTTVGALAMQSASVDNCPSGRIGLNIQWGDTLVTYACSVDAVADKTLSEVLGVVVRWSDGSVSTVDLPTEASASATQSAQTLTSTTSSLSTSTSSSSSTSTTCVNGQCTTTTSHSVCSDGDC